MLTPAMTAETVPIMAKVLPFKLYLELAAPLLLLEDSVPLLPAVETVEGS
jgi:hypothetical protein